MTSYNNNRSYTSTTRRSAAAVAPSQISIPIVPIAPGSFSAASYASPSLNTPLGSIDPLDLAGQNMPSSHAKTAGGASDFVKKLYNMLEDGAHNHIVSWTQKGDSFLVKDMNEFTKTILPKHFKHSNFASFVRQLNKYDFHKVKTPESTESGVYGDHTWEFKHPSFRSDMKGELEQIKRKGPAPRKASATTSGKGAISNSGNEDVAERMAGMQQQIDLLAQDQHNLIAHVGNLSRDYHAAFQDVAMIRRSVTTQDSSIQNLISYIVTSEKSKARNEGRITGPDDPNFMLSPDAQQLVNSYNDAARSTMEQMEELQRRPSMLSGRLLTSGSAVERLYPVLNQDQDLQENKSSPSSQSVEASTPKFGEDDMRQSHSRNSVTSCPPYNPLITQAGPSSSFSGHVGFSQMLPPPPQNSSSSSMKPLGSGQQVTYQPSWTTAPKVLLVEDDAVCRKISSKFLEVFGCTIDVATDGVSAVNKMNSEKYDLVFMDIMMPHLDGVSATQLIRQFDPMTPIISMTSNSNPQEILTYFSHGMTDILPKPFTKEGLLGMLDKHLLHLKQMQYLSEIPRALGVPDSAIQEAIVSTFSDPSANNPFAEMMADMGTEDPDYVRLLASLVNGASENSSRSTPLKRDSVDAMLGQSSSAQKKSRLEIEIGS